MERENGSERYTGTMVDIEDDPIELVASRHHEWEEQFHTERERIHSVLSAHSLETRIKRIEHIGSTAIPDLPAKDIVDLDIVVSDGSVGESSRTLQRELGGTCVENTEDWHPVFRVHDGQRFNDHVFGESAVGWKVSVVTRDVLRAHPPLRDEYERLKHTLASEHEEIKQYSMGKAPFIRRLLDVARADDDLRFEFEIPVL